MKNFFASFKYAFAGIISVLKNERNFKVQLIIGVLVLLSAFILKADVIEWVVIILCIGLVLSFEMINTAIEKICNFLHPDEHPQIKTLTINTKDFKKLFIFFLFI